MKTINNPLNLQFLYPNHYFCPGEDIDVSGEYVDKELAVEMLEVLEEVYWELNKLGVLQGTLLQDIISKAKGK